jgi:protein-L-isoaspartate(D-aspartate) O-methyltransferase
MLTDSYKQKGRRKRLIKELQDMGIQSKRVLLALEKLPRHFFFPEDFEEKAYENIAFPIEAGQTISQPYTVAYQTELLQIQKGDKVLEVGTGSGYQAAVLKVLGADVYTIETKKALYTKSKALFLKLGLKIHSFYGDGSKGLPEHAPFNKILLTAAAPKLTNVLTQQLKIGGRLVAPVGDKTVQNMILIERTGENEYKKTQFGRFTFVPLTGTHGWTD